MRGDGGNFISKEGVGDGGWGRGELHFKEIGMLVVPFRGGNYGF